MYITTNDKNEILLKFNNKIYETFPYTQQGLSNALKRREELIKELKIKL